MTDLHAGSVFSVQVRELEDRHDQQLHLADIAVRKLYAVKVKRALKRLKFKRRPAHLADELLRGDRHLADILGSSEGQWEREIMNACTEYQGLRDITFLLIYAPRSNTCLSIAQDRQAREKQMQKFYNIMTLDREREKCLKTMVSVQTYSILKQHLQAFMLEDATKSKRAYVVFNGHGNDRGQISLEKEENGVSNTQFINDIYDAWRVCRRTSVGDSGAMILPERISVVLAQCYGYKHEVDDEATSVIDVVCLAKPDNPRTKFVYKLNNVGNAVTDATHIELIEYARDVVRLERTESDTTVLPADDSVSHVMTSRPCRTESNGEIADARTRGLLDVTTLACLAFNRSTQEPAGINSTSAIPLSNMATLLPGITNLEISVTRRRLSDYCTPEGDNKSITNMVRRSAGFALAVGAGEQEMTTPEVAPKTGSSRSRQGSTTSSTKQQVVPRPEAAQSEAARTTSRQTRTHKSVTGACMALVGLSSPLGQIAQQINIQDHVTRGSDDDLCRVTCKSDDIHDHVTRKPDE